MSYAPAINLTASEFTESNEIAISSSSSEEGDSPFLTRVRASAETTSIRELILAAKDLLVTAESKSHPEPFRYGGGPIYRYNFSSEVTGQDLFRERELTDLVGIVQTLKARLSAERVFALGCPQLRSERDVFDEVLLRFSHELTEPGNDAASSSSTLSQHLTTEAENLRQNGSRAETDHQTLSQVVRLNSALETPENVGHCSSSTLIRDKEGHEHVKHLRNDHVSSIDNSGRCDTEKSGGLSISESILDKFIENVNSLVTMTTDSSKLVLRDLPKQEISKIFLNIYKCASTVTKNTSSSTPPSPNTSPRQRKRKYSGECSNDMTKKCKPQEGKSEKADWKNEEIEEENSCPICLEPWTSGGEHGLICLKCGHLFGQSCILKWVQQARSCPQCKAVATENDVRKLFVTKIVATDTSERDRALVLLKEEQVARRSSETREATARRKLDVQLASNEDLLAELNQMKAKLSHVKSSSFSSQSISVSQASTSQPAGTKRYHHFQKVNISDGNCRVFDHCKELNMLVISQKSPNPLFRGHGIKILTRDFKPLSYQHLHPGVIRDMKFRPGMFNGTLLSCGLDKLIQLTSVTNTAVLQKYTVNSSVWCCTWNTQNTNLFYAGLEKGVVKEFDIRQTNSSVRDVVNNGGSPICSIHYWNGSEDQENFRGVLIAQVQGLMFMEECATSQFLAHNLPPVPAPLTSVSLHPSGRFLTSFRPNVNNPKCLYEISRLCQSQDIELSTISARMETTWKGDKMQAVMSRNCLITQPESENDLFAVTACHSSNTVSVRNPQRKLDFQSLQCHDKAIDIKPISSNCGSEDLLGVLTDKDLFLYQWRE